MTPANDTGKEALPATPPLAAARSVHRLLTEARDQMLDAEGAAAAGGLTHMSEWVRLRIEDVESYLLADVRFAVEALEAEARRR